MSTETVAANACWGNSAASGRSRSTSPPRPGAGSNRTLPKATIGATSRHLSSAASRIWTPSAWTCFSYTAHRRRVGILARLPLSSGLLTGKFDRNTRFEANDHRAFNRHGESFDRGETFSGLDYELGLGVVEQLQPLVPTGMNMPQMALGWILMFPAVTCGIPGAT